MANKKALELSRSGSPATSPAPSRSASESSKAPSPTEPKSQIDFQFLNFSHPAEAKASRARKTVRSHVTRQQHQREHAAAAARRAKSLPYPEDERESNGPTPLRNHAATFPPNRPTLDLPTVTPESGHAISSPEASSHSPSPISSPSQITESRLDPAEAYPEEWRPYIPRVIEHYLSHLATDVPDVDGPRERGLLRTRFLPLCMTDRAPLHAFVLMAASHYRTMHGSRSLAIDVLQLRAMAISEINSALPDPIRGTSDQIIAAVAQMASYETLHGDRITFNTHMTGLLRMVSLRGGLPALGLDGLLERLLLWIDANAAHILGTHVYFDKHAYPSNVDHPVPDPQSFMGGIPRRTSR